MSFGEEKLVQGSEHTGSISSVLLHALQRITLAGLVSRAHPCPSALMSITPVPAEAAARYLGTFWVFDSMRIAARGQPAVHSCKPSKTSTSH